MPMQWTAEADQRLLLVIVDLVKLNGKAIAEGWARKYGHEGKHTPTDRAIDQHIDKLKGNVSGKSKSAAKNGTPSKALAAARAPVTPRKPASTKTPTSSAKRKHTAMSEEDDSEPEIAKSRLSESVGNRNSIPRKGKNNTPAYKLDSDDDNEDNLDGTKDVNAQKSENGSGTFDDLVDFDGAAGPQSSHSANGVAKGHRATNGAFALPSRGTSRKSMSPTKMRSKTLDSDAESDISSFSAGFT